MGVLIAGAPALGGAAHATVLAATHRAAPAGQPSTHRSELPKGGVRIIGHYRVVTYYGGPGGPQLGILGSKPPDQIAADIERRARQWRGYGLPVQPAMELIATVAQGSPGADGSYSAADLRSTMCSDTSMRPTATTCCSSSTSSPDTRSSSTR